VVREDFYQLTLGQLLRPLVELNMDLGAHIDDVKGSTQKGKQKRMSVVVEIADP
jgi:hypothetical protein